MFNADYTPGVFYTALITGALPQTPSPTALGYKTMNHLDIATRLRPNIKVEFRDSAINYWLP
jgi:hypothetical protein